MGKHSATGKHAKFSAVNMLRIANGKVVAYWNHQHEFGLMQQLDALVYAGSNR